MRTYVAALDIQHNESRQVFPGYFIIELIQGYLRKIGKN
jgi:hypothetical protein